MKENLFFKLLDDYQRYHQSLVTTKRFKYEKILPLIDSLKAIERFSVENVGISFQGREIKLVTWGGGTKKILLWAQMHGDESTATRALLDVWRFLSASDEFDENREMLHASVTLYFIPVLNPDGANLFQRRTAQGIDMNRDAVRLQTPEGRLLKYLRDKINPEFAFNLHDQNIYYSAGDSEFPATLSFLAPAYNSSKDVDENRSKSMSVIAHLYRLLEEIIPGHTAKYDDTYNPRAFGDNIQKWGSSTILIESGGYTADPQKEYIRKLNFALIIEAIHAIGSGSYAEHQEEIYYSIPFNVKDKYFDLIIRNCAMEISGKIFKTDIGIVRDEISINNFQDFIYKSRIHDLGDLSQFHAYEELDVNGMKVVPGKIYPYHFESMDELKHADFNQIHGSGYTWVQLDNQTEDDFTYYPINISNTRQLLELAIQIDQYADLIFMDGLEVKHTIVNGFVVNPGKKNMGVPNGLVYVT